MKSAAQAIWDPNIRICDFEAEVSELAASEIPGIKAIWTEQRDRLKGTRQLSDFTEKLSREWAIETGVIENLYELDRGVTETLIEHGFQIDLLGHGATNKPKEYVLQLLRDQKDTLDGLFDFVKSERKLSASYIKDIHAALLRSQTTTEGLDANGRRIDVPLVRGAWKKQENYPVKDGVQYLYCPPEHVESEMERLIEIHSLHVEEDVPSELQAAWLHHRFTQIHPFQDGNGRVARALASLVLVKDGLFPLVITRGDKPRYIDALEAADNGNLQLLVDLFVKSQATQFRKASAISEAILIEDDVRSALNSLLLAADRVAKEKVDAPKSVFNHAAKIEQDLQDRLQELVPTISDALERVYDNHDVFVNRSSDQTAPYYRSQIIYNAKHRFNYFANTYVYRTWVSMHMRWARRGQLVFAIHGIGKPFNGSLICSPFLEFKDIDEGESRVSLVPIAEEGFVFYYTEQQERLMVRFRVWRESVLKIFIKELSQNL